MSFRTKCPKSFADFLDISVKSKRPILITTNSNKNCIKSILYQLSKKLKKQKVDYRIIRTSVIRNWLKHTNLRKIQYFSGHRYISSTERYITTDIEKLKENIVKYHPF